MSLTLHVADDCVQAGSADTNPPMTIDDMEPQEGHEQDYIHTTNDDNSSLLDEVEDYDKLVECYDGLTLAEERSRGCEDRDRGASISFEAMCQVCFRRAACTISPTSCRALVLMEAAL